jgi:hypothetical protein
MAVSQAQIVDLLYKQAFGVTKTDTSTNKSPSNESIPSPLLLRGDTLWTQANQIPGVAAATAGIVQAYTGASAIQCTADTTTVPIGGIYPTWLTSLTYWIPSEFGATYTAQVWIDNPGVANPTATGTQIFAAGSGGNGQYYYNYQSGVLNFIGETIPAALTAGKVLYIVGYRYIGLTGVTNLPSGTSIGNLTFNDSTIGSTANANITLTPNGTGIVKFTTNIESNSNISANNMSITGNANITGNISANYISGNGANITGVVATSADKLTNGNTTVQTYSNGNVTFNIANTANGNVAVANVVVVSISGIDITGNINATGNINGANINGNITGNISGNITIPGPTTGVVINDGGNANSSNGFTFVSGSNIANIANTLNVGNLLSVTGAINAFSTLNLTGNIALGSLYQNEIVNLSNSTLEIRGGYNNTSGQLSLFAGATGNSAKILLSAASNSIASEADAFTFLNRANNFTLVTISNTTIATTSTSTGALVANGGVGVSGNIFAGGLINVTGNITTSALISTSLTSNFANLVLSAATGDNSVVLTPTGNGTVDVSSKRITSLATPTASTDAATKQYVDDVAQGLNIHDSAQAATSNSLANLTGGTITYNNGASGVGANLVLTGSPTANFISANVFDGNVTLSATNRLLVKNETNAAYNGIYVVSNATVLTRAADFNSVPEVEAGDFVFVTAGTAYDNTGWVQTSTVAVIGTDPIDWTQFSGAGTYQAGNGLTLTGSVFSVNTDNNTTAIVGGNVVVKDSANLTTPNIGAATGNSLSLTGTLTANTLTANLTLGVTGNANVGNLGTGGLIIATGNITGGNINTSGEVVATGNGTFGNISTTGSGGNITGANVVSANTFSGNLVASTANISGNLITNNLTVNLELSGNTANFTGNVQLPNIYNTTANTSISMGVGSGIVAITSTGNSTQFKPGGQVELSGASQIIGGTFAGSGITLGTSQTDIFQNRGGNVTVQVGTGGSISDTWTFANNGNTLFPGAGAVNLGNLATANYVNVSQQLNGNVANFSGNLTSLNANLGNLATANYVNVSQEINGNVANFSGNLTTLNANLGNLATANYVNVSQQLNGNVANFSGNLTSLNANFGNLATANYVNVSQEINGNVANFSGNLTSLNANLGNLATANYVNVSQEINGNVANFSGKLTTNTATVTTLTQSNSIIYTDTNGNLQQSANLTFSGTQLDVTGTANITGNVSVGNLSTTGTLTAAVFEANTVDIGNTTVTANTVTTTAITANQTIASFEVTGSTATGFEFLVKGHDTVSNAKYSVATVLAVTDGSNVDYVTYGTVRIGASTGTLAVNMSNSGSNYYVNLQATPASTNATVWTTQVRTI